MDVYAALNPHPTPVNTPAFALGAVSDTDHELWTSVGVHTMDSSARVMGIFSGGFSSFPRSD